MADFLSYIKAAFTARPAGMFVSPNIVGLAAIGLLSVINPGFLLIGLGLEVAYLVTLASNHRFQRYVDGMALIGDEAQSADQVRKRLIPPDLQRVRQLEAQCQWLTERRSRDRDATVERDVVDRLVTVFATLLLQRRDMEELAGLGPKFTTREDLPTKLASLDAQLASVRDPNLVRSLTSQAQILRQRIETQQEARRRIEFLDAELVRMEQQLQLLREQAMIETDPEIILRRVDAIATRLDTNAGWLPMTVAAPAATPQAPQAQNQP